MFFSFLPGRLTPTVSLCFPARSAGWNLTTSGWDTARQLGSVSIVNDGHVRAGDFPRLVISPAFAGDHNPIPRLTFKAGRDMASIKLLPYIPDVGIGADGLCYTF